MAIDTVANLSLDDSVKAQFCRHAEYLNAVTALLDDKPVQYFVPNSVECVVANKSECMESAD